MVRIIDTSPDPKVVKRTSCRRGCGVRLEYVPNDVQSRRYTDYGGGSDTYYWIVCPNCHEEVEVSGW